MITTMEVSNGSQMKANAAPNPNKTLLEKEDFTKIAVTMRDSGRTLVDSLGVRKGMKILDLGCGDGTTAAPAAQLGAEVLGVDIARNFVLAGRRRAAELGLPNLKLQEGDPTNLDTFADGSFDMVISILARCLRPSRMLWRVKWYG